MRQSFGIWLKQRRSALSLSQAQLARQVGCSPALIRKIESGERRASSQLVQLMMLPLGIGDEERAQFVALARSQLGRPQTTLPDSPIPLSPLTRRERDILQLMTADIDNDQIAERLVMTVGTVRWYVKQIYGKLGVHNRDEAVLYAEQLRLVASADAAVESSVSHNLPTPATSLVGRRNEIDHLRDLLDQPTVRLLTLVGAAGIGKTRLSLETAAAIRPTFPDGVFFVALASLSDPALVANAVAAELKLSELRGEPIAEALKAYLRTRRLLLVLDNFEHLLAAAPLVADLLAAAPGLKVLATSRERLHLYGEYEFLVPTLTLPDPGTASDMDELAQSEAVTLFTQRAQAVKANFRLTAENTGIVADICRQLDGLPLAIELAAARIKLYPPSELRRRLNRRLNTLTSGARDLPTRHQTLRGAIAWSYDLLTEAERKLFARLGIFKGGWTLEAMEAICAADLPIDSHDGLESLLNKSLVQQSVGSDEELRFTMLETIREYALEQLAASEEESALWEAYGDYFLALAETAEPELRLANQLMWMYRLEAEHNNLRSALDWSLRDCSNAEIAGRLTSAIWYFWSTQAHYHEGIDWAEKTLNCADLSESTRAKTLAVSGTLALFLRKWALADKRFREALALAEKLGDLWLAAHMQLRLARVEIHNRNLALAMTLLETAIRQARVLEDEWLLASALLSLGVCLRWMDNFGQSRVILEDALALIRRLGLALEIGLFMTELGRTAVAQRQYTEAIFLFEDSLSFFEKVNNGYLVAQSLRLLGDTRRIQGDLNLANQAYRKSLNLFRDIGDEEMEARLLVKLGFVASRENLLSSAISRFRDALLLARQYQEVVTLGVSMAGLAQVTAAQGDFSRAAVLLAVAEVRFQTASSPRTDYVDKDEVDALFVSLRQQLSETEFADAWAIGTQMRTDEAIAYALEISPAEED